MSASEVLGLIGVHKLRLMRGGHGKREQGVCLMEAVAWFNNEEHSDHPVCVDPVLGAYGRALNDRLSDEERQAMVPLVPRLVGTAGTTDLSQRRRWLLTDRVIRTILPLVFETRWPKHAAKIRALPEVTAQTAAKARQVCSEARSAADAADADAYASAAAYAYAAADAASNRAVRVQLAISALSDAIDLR